MSEDSPEINIETWFLLLKKVFLALFAFNPYFRGSFFNCLLFRATLSDWPTMRKAIIFTVFYVNDPFLFYKSTEDTCDGI